MAATNLHLGHNLKVLIDTDPGTDDAIALIMALNSTDLDVVGLTTVGGNASLLQTTRNALRILEYMGRKDVPVSKGASRPLKGKFDYAYHHHGPAGLTVKLPLPKTEPILTPAPDFIIQKAREYAGELTLIAIGPLTNVANAITDCADLKGWLKEIIVMGGAVDVPGNVTPFAEFNIYDDPVAANIVLSCGAPVTLVGLDVCNDAYVTAEDRDWFVGNSLGGRLAARILSNWFKPRDNDAVYHLCDPLAIATAIRPELLTYQQALVTVETEDSNRVGQTTATFGDGNVKVATTVRANEAKELINSLLKD